METINKIFKNKFKNLIGTDMNIEIPIQESILNKMLTENVNHKKIESIKLNFVKHNHFVISIVVRINSLIKPVVRLGFKLYETYNLKEDSFNIHTRIVDESCSIFLGKKMVINEVKNGIKESLPPYLFFEQNVMMLNVKKLFDTNEVVDILNYIDAARFEIELDDRQGELNNKLWIKFQVKI